MSSAGIKVSEEFFNKFGKKFPPESFLAKEGDKGDTMFIIYSGKVNVIKNTPAGEKVLATLGEGDFFGEMAVMGTMDRRAATVKTVIETKVLELNRMAFEAIIRRSPEIAMKVIQSLTERVRDANGKATALIHKNDFVRAANFMKHMAEDRGVEAPANAPGRCFAAKPEFIASQIGVKPDVFELFVNYARKARMLGRNGDWFWAPYPQYLQPFGDLLATQTGAAK